MIYFKFLIINYIIVIRKLVLVLRTPLKIIKCALYKIIILPKKFKIYLLS